MTAVVGYGDDIEIVVPVEIRRYDVPIVEMYFGIRRNRENKVWTRAPTSCLSEQTGVGVDKASRGGEDDTYQELSSTQC